MEQESSKSNYAPIYIFIGIIVLLGAVGALVYQNHTDYKPGSFIPLTPSPIINKTQNAEPSVTSFDNYNNNKFNFSIDYPSGWNKQEFETSSPSDGLLIAFSPDALPCGTCTYLREGFFSIRVYNQKTDPQLYTSFQQRMTNAKNSRDYQLISMGKAKGVIYQNSIALENETWVYELSLDANNGNTKVTDSKLFQKILSLFKFTGIIFNN